MAFQLIDDLLGIWGVADRTGKPVRSDLASRKKSLPVVAAMASGSDAGQRLSEIYGTDGELGDELLAAAAQAVDDAGGRAWATEEAHRETVAAHAIIARLDVPQDVRADLEALTDPARRAGSVTGAEPSSGDHPTTGGRRWRISHVPVTGSTNADLAAAAASGAPDGTVLVTDEQTAGRGRLGRQWQAPAGSSLMFSALVRPGSVPAARRGWVGAILGLAIVDAIRTVGPVRPQLKWPNDVLIGEAKVAGILAELVDDGIVVGSGINLTQTADELPISTATSLALSGAPGVRRDDLLTTILEHFGALLADWEAADGDVTGGSPPTGQVRPTAVRQVGKGNGRHSILDRYKQNLSTLGRAVTVHLPDDRRLSGIARDITADGLLVVVDEDGASHRFAAGDVVHVRR